MEQHNPVLEDQAVQDSSPPQAPAAAGMRLGGARRAIATLALTAGLLAIGGVSAVMAASPDPSASTAPSASQGTGSGSASGTTHNCKASSSSNGSGSSTSPSSSATN